MTNVSVPRHLKEHVQAIQEEVRANARTPSRPSAAEWAPHIAMLIELGYTDDEINAAFGWEPTKRYLRKIKAEGRLDGSGLVRIDKNAVEFDKLDPEYQAMLEWSPEAFIAFYDRFSDRPMPEHCKEWVHEAFASDLLMLNVPPRHNKSTLFSIWWPIWNIVRDRDKQILIVSLTGTLSTRWVGYIAAYLSYGDIPNVFGKFKPDKQDGEIPWRPSKGELMVLGRKRGGGGMQFSILSRSDGAQILGFEGDIIVADDVTSKRIATSPTVRQQQIEWFQEEVLSRMNPDGRALIIGQRVHLYDLYGYLREQVYENGPMKDEPIWTTITHPAVTKWPDEEGSGAEVLWEQVWPYERLMKSYALVGGKAAFMTMYQQDPTSADATLVKEEWLERCRDYDRAGGRGYYHATGEGYLPVVRVASLDPSPTQYNGLVVADVVSNKDTFFCAVVFAESFKTDWRGIREEIVRVIKDYRPQYFLFEKNIAQYWAKGDPFIEELRSMVRVLEHTTSAANKYEAELGLESLSFDFEMGNIRLPYGDVVGAGYSKIIEMEASMWTREGRLRDDVLMALWFIKFNYKRLSPVQFFKNSFRGQEVKPFNYIQRARGKQDVAAEYRKRRALARRSD